jgi:ankyrin repeat protein
MRNSKIMLIAAVILLQVTASPLADENTNEASAISPISPLPQAAEGPSMKHEYQRNTSGSDQAVPAYQGVTAGKPAGEPETEAQQADNTKINKITDHPGDKARHSKPAQGMPVSKPPEAQKNFNWGKHMPAAATRRHGEGVAYPGYRGQGGTGYPQHRQYGNPPRYPVADQATQSSQAQNNAVTGEANGPSPEYQTGTADPPRITTDKRRALLHAASFGDVTSLNNLLRQGASPNARAKDRTGRTALILAAAGGHIEIVKALLAKGATVDDRDLTGHTALNWAAMRNRTNVAIALIDKGADINTKDNNGISPLLYAIGTHNTAMVRLLVTSGAELEVETRDNKMTPLLLAIEHGDIKTINILLGKGANVNGANRDKFSPLMAAAEKGQAEIVRRLLARGAKVNQYDNKSLTPLFYAADNQHIETMKLLLAKGADANARDRKARTAIMRAAIQGHADVIRVLLTNGADINATDANGNTALMLAKAANKQDAVKLLLNSGAGSNN